MMRTKSQIGIGYLIVLFGMLAVRALGQAQDSPEYVPTMTFDIASVREAQPTSPMMVGGTFQPHSSVLKLQNIPVDWLLSIAYGIQPYQVTGLPDWARRAIFNVQAKSDSEADAKLAKLGNTETNLEHQHMMQALLAERFNLKTHWETKEGPILELTVVKSGSKLHPAGSMPPTQDELKRFGDRPVPPLYQRGDGRKGYEYVAHGTTIAIFANILQMNYHTTVVDKTGLTDKYDFLLQYSGARPSRENDDPNVWPPMDDAVPDQLGLKLISGKGPTKMLVIDHMDKLSEN